MRLVKVGVKVVQRLGLPANVRTHDAAVYRGHHPHPMQPVPVVQFASSGESIPDPHYNADQLARRHMFAAYRSREFYLNGLCAIYSACLTQVIR